MAVLQKSDRVCVIGAGPSGLAVCKALNEAGIAFDCFEAHRAIGGIWDVGGSAGGGYASLHTNTSKSRMAYSDYPFAEALPQFLHHSQMLEYFNRYVDRFGFRERIRLDCRVESARPHDDDRWQIELATGERREYAACIVATGQYATRRWPNPMPPGRFDGAQIHAADYLDPTTPLDLRDQRVVVVGLGSSAAEIATELAGGSDGSMIASRVMISARSGRYILPKIIDGVPLDASAPHPSLPLPRPIGWLPEALRVRLLRALIERALGRIERAVGRPESWNLPNPTFGPWAERPTLSDGFIPALETHRVEARPAIAAFDGSSIQFSDGTVAEADVVVWATGYRPDYPFLDDKILGCDAAELALYRRIAHPTRDNLYFVGFTRVLCSLWPVSEQQAKWVVGALQGTLTLPSRERRAGKSIQVSKTLPVICNSYVGDLSRDLSSGRRPGRSAPQ